MPSSGPDKPRSSLLIGATVASALAMGAISGDVRSVQTNVRKETHDVMTGKKEFVQPIQPVGNLDLEKLLEVVKKYDPVNRTKPISRDAYWEVMICITQRTNIPDSIQILSLIAEKDPGMIFVFENDIKQHKDKKIAALYQKLTQKAGEVLKKKDPKSWKWFQDHSAEAWEREMKTPKKTPRASANETSPPDTKEKSPNTPIKGKFVEFPSGLRLAVAKGKEVLNEWKDNTPTAMEFFRKKFGKAREKDIDRQILQYVKKNCSGHVPIVEIRPEDLGRKISKYFTVGELVKVDTKKKHLMEARGTWKKHEQFMMYDNDGNCYWKFARIDMNLCHVLDTIRDEVDFPLVIDEGVRSYEYNRDMYRANGGKPVLDSPHPPGKGVDLLPPGDSSQKAKLKHAIIKTLSGKGGGFGDYGPVYHVDTKIGPSKAGGNWIELGNGKIGLRLRTW